MLEDTYSVLLTTTGITANAVVVTKLGTVDSTTVITACTPFTNAAALSGALAIVDDGDCPAQTKADRVAEAGAIGLIIVAVQGQAISAPNVTTALPMLITDNASGTAALLLLYPDNATKNRQYQIISR